jgi:hypothetical protein
MIKYSAYVEEILSYKTLWYWVLQQMWMVVQLVRKFCVVIL